MTPSELMLVLRAQQGDREALDRLLDAVQGRLFRYIAAVFSGDVSTAEDVLQETLWRVARKLKWLSEPRAFEAWVYRIASNEIARAARRRPRVLPLEEAAEVAAAEAVPARLGADDFRRMVEALSPASRAVVVLHYQEDRPLEEIAAVLDVPLGTVKSRLAYGLRCLRERNRA